jgi:hypothetical protein
MLRNFLLTHLFELCNLKLLHLSRYHKKEQLYKNFIRNCLKRLHAERAARVIRKFLFIFSAETASIDLRSIGLKSRAALNSSLELPHHRPVG